MYFRVVSDERNLYSLPSQLDMVRKLYKFPSERNKHNNVEGKKKRGKEQDPEPDPLVKGTDPRIRIRIRIRTKMSRIHNTAIIKIRSSRVLFNGMLHSEPRNPVPDLNSFENAGSVTKLKIMCCCSCCAVFVEKKWARC
jgi:hypothetical protein